MPESLENSLPLTPSLFENIEGDVKDFNKFFQAVRDISPVPMGFEELTDSDGYYHQLEKRIALRAGMSERQTSAAAIHEIAHATLHALDPERLQESLKERGKDKRTMEIEAESIAFVVCSHYGIETGEKNSFGYIAMYSKDRTLPELKASLKVIRDTASDMIGKIDDRIRELELAEEKEKENTLLTGNERMYGIYQIAEGTAADAFAFMGMDFVEKQGLTVCREDYRLIYSGILRVDDTLEGIYEKFNLDYPEDFTGHSLSVSDVVLIHDDGKNTAYYVDSIGFQAVKDFLKSRKEQRVDDRLEASEERQEQISVPDQMKRTDQMPESVYAPSSEQSHNYGISDTNSAEKTIEADIQIFTQNEMAVSKEEHSKNTNQHKKRLKRKSR